MLHVNYTDYLSVAPQAIRGTSENRDGSGLGVVFTSSTGTVIISRCVGVNGAINSPSYLLFCLARALSYV